MQTCLFTHQAVEGSNKAFTCVWSLDIAKTPQISDDTNLMAESKEELKSLLIKMKVKNLA